MIFVLLLTVLFWVLSAFNIIFVLRDLLRYDLRLVPEEGPSPELSSVTLIVPMRDEVANVDRCLAAVRRQSHPEIEVIVVDDGSTDGTADRLAELQREWPSLRVVTLDGPPPGWAGKTHAMHRGVQEARGEWLLFIDADVVLTEHAVATAVRTSHRNSWPILSLHGGVVYETFWERTLLLPVAILTHGYQVMMPGTVLNGQFILIRRAVYDDIDGFASVRGAVVEDAAFAHRLVECGHRPRVRVWPGAYRCRMYESRTEMWEGLTRMLAGYNGFQAAPLIIVGMLYSSVLVPQFVFIGLLISALLGGPAWGGLIAAAGTLSAVHLLISLVIARRLGAPLSAALLKPIADLNVTALFLESARRASFGGVTWKGRRYADWTSTHPPPAEPLPSPDPPEVGVRLSVIVPLSTDAAEGVVENELRRIADLARLHPETEVIGVHSGPAPNPPATLTNLRLASAPGGSYWGLRRAGLEAARAPVVAVSGATPDDRSTWTEAILAAFDDPEVHLVTGPTRYEGTGAAATAASVREWGHLTDPWTVYPSPENFAGRRETLLRLLPTGDLTRIEGATLLGMLASLDGRTFKVVDEAGAGVPTGGHGGLSITRLMADRLFSATSLTMSAWRWTDRQPSLTLFWIRLMPLTVSGDTVLLTLRVLNAWFKRHEVPRARRLGVVLWLHLLYALDLLLAFQIMMTWRRRFRDDRFESGTDDRTGWRDRILGLARRMLVSPRHRPVSAP